MIIKVPTYAAIEIYPKRNVRTKNIESFKSYTLTYKAFQSEW